MLPSSKPHCGTPGSTTARQTADDTKKMWPEISSDNGGCFQNAPINTLWIIETNGQQTASLEALNTIREVLKANANNGMDLSAQVPARPRVRLLTF